MAESPFGPPELWRHDDLVAVSREFDADLVQRAYRCGLFPMPARGGLMGWWSPLDRAVLPLDGLRVSRSLRKMVPRYEIRVDTDFEGVLAGCGDPRRPDGWIDGAVRRVYRQLHAAGTVHSVEAWTADGELAGGLYGVSIGGLFAGESMFHRPDIGRDASKVALVALVDLLRAGGARGPAARRAVGHLPPAEPRGRRGAAAGLPPAAGGGAAAGAAGLDARDAGRTHPLTRCRVP